MEFLEKLYSIDNFGIYLFVVIGVLVVLFLVILFFGKKDAKKRKDAVKDEGTEHAGETNVPLFQETSEAKPVEVPVTPVNNSMNVQEEPFPVVNNVLNDDLISENNNIFVSSQDDNLPKEEKEFDFDALAAAISKELESIEKTEPEKTVVEEAKPVLPKEEESPLRYQVFEPVEEVSKNQSTVVFEEPVREEAPLQKEEPVKPKPVMPKVFSSVYVNRDIEEPKITEGTKPVEEVVSKPVAPKIELPKIMDLPKKHDEPISSEDDIIFR